MRICEACGWPKNHPAHFLSHYGSGCEPVTYDPADGDTYPSVCSSPELVLLRFGFVGGETLAFDSRGNYLGQVEEGTGELINRLGE